MALNLPWGATQIQKILGVQGSRSTSHSLCFPLQAPFQGPSGLRDLLAWPLPILTHQWDGKMATKHMVRL